MENVIKTFSFELEKVMKSMECSVKSQIVCEITLKNMRFYIIVWFHITLH